MKVLLMDNGSLEPAPTLTLRQMAAALSVKLGTEVAPISLLHSSAVSADQLNGSPAEIFEPALERRLRDRETEFLLVPAFFGPSGALTDYLPKRIRALKAKFPQLSLRLAPPLVDTSDASDTRIAAILETRVRQAGIAQGVSSPGGPRITRCPVVLVDHGSPLPAVTAVRNHIAQQLGSRLSNFAATTVPASMERRPGLNYAFSDPLLEAVFDEPGFDRGLVIIALLFLSAGRHAGPDGDIAQICECAKRNHPDLRPLVLDPIGADPTLIEILADRAKQGFLQAPI